MINKRLILETSIDDFITNDQPRSNNIATWIMQLYELEFKLNIINRYPHYFDVEDNTSGISLEEVKRALENNVKIIGKYLLSILYEIAQSWVNYHDTSKLFPNLLSVGNRFKSNTYEFPFVPNYCQYTTVKNWFSAYPKDNQNEQLDRELIYKFLDLYFDNHFSMETLSPANILANYISGTKTSRYPNLLPFKENCIQIAKEYYDNNDINVKLISNIDIFSYRIQRYLAPIREFYINLKNVNQEDQNNYKLEIYQNIWKILTDKQLEFRTWLNTTFDDITEDLIQTISKLIDDIYAILVNIDNMSQRQILMKQNMVINVVHHTSSFQVNLEEIDRGLWLQSDTYKYYPYDVRDIIPSQIISQVTTYNTVIFSGKDQLDSSILRIQNLFVDKRQAKDYISDTIFTVKQKDENGNITTDFITDLNPTNFLTIMSNLPRPELRYWATELMKFGLDKHIHLLMEI